MLKEIQQQTLEGHSCLEHPLDRNFPIPTVKNVNISLFLIKLHIWRSAGEWMNSSIINFGIRRRWALDFTPLLLYVRGKFEILYFSKKSLLWCFSSTPIYTILIAARWISTNDQRTQVRVLCDDVCNATWQPKLHASSPGRAHAQSIVIIEISHPYQPIKLLVYACLTFGHHDTNKHLSSAREEHKFLWRLHLRCAGFESWSWHQPSCLRFSSAPSY